MSWLYAEMACGINLGTLLLICLFQAEHVRCLWATQAQGSQRPNGNAYVGFLQKDIRIVGSDPQNQFRQASASRASAQRSGLGAEPAVSGGYSQGFSSSRYSQTVLQPAHGGYSSVRLAQSSSVSNPKQVNAPGVRRREIVGLSTAIASGTSLSQRSQKQNSLADRRTRPAEQGAWRVSQHRSRNSASAQNPTYSALAAKSSSLFSAEGPVPVHSSIRKHTSATGRARRVSSGPKAATSKPSSFSGAQNERTRNDPSRTAEGNRFQSKLFAVAEPYKQNSAAFAPRSLGGSRGTNAGDSQRFAPTKTHIIPQHFGGSPIRRLSEQEQVVQTSRPKFTAPSQQTASYNPQAQSVHPQSNWMRISRPRQ